MREFFKVFIMLLTSGYDVDVNVSEELEFEIEESPNKQEVLLSGTV